MGSWSMAHGWSDEVEDVKFEILVLNYLLVKVGEPKIIFFYFDHFAWVGSAGGLTRHHVVQVREIYVSDEGSVQGQHI